MYPDALPRGRRLRAWAMACQPAAFASERTGDGLKGFNNFNPEIKARIWL
jgi:hypothetical protein